MYSHPESRDACCSVTLNSQKKERAAVIMMSSSSCSLLAAKKKYFVELDLLCSVMFTPKEKEINDELNNYYSIQMYSFTPSNHIERSESQLIVCLFHSYW
ncbi:hypothetical protein T10_10636 [Trichinella papuae]|uniref:Uncharacterized protein n=1 Tax=Trichinella papuae TaxID=268474 RepID=A0A0V1N3Q5_9BILA|nr:hypothetical protein T10_10636 [Trichinella papuae]